MAAKGDVIAAADLTPTLGEGCPLQVTRTWSISGGHLALHFAIHNPTNAAVEIGALGIPMVFNNIITDRSLEQAHAACSFSDPYIGQDGGYLQVTRLTGKGSALVVVPDGHTPFEGYQLLHEPMHPNQTFEGMFAWLAHTEAYSESDWKGAHPWNAPTMASVAPGATLTYGVKFLVAKSIRDIDSTLAANRRPVAVGIPGYVLPMDQDGRLFLKYGKSVKEVSVEPAGAIELRRDRAKSRQWQAYTLHGKQWGRARVTITYADGLKQTVSYYVIKPERQVVQDLGHFLTTKQWYVNDADPFHRSPAPISYDYEKGEQITQESRVWIAGLGDEGGSGSYIATAMKEFGAPDRGEVAKLEGFVDKVLWGGIQYKDGPNKYGVRKSMFYYDPKELPNFRYDPSMDWRSWTSWNKQSSEDIGRGYNYPHVVATYWSLYRVARNHPGMVTSHPWSWYLDQAYQTTMFLTSTDANGEDRVGWMQLGLMEGSIFIELLQDLKREGWTQQSTSLEERMKIRADRWSKRQYPFGSEMAWDSTGQEEVYGWSRYFGYNDQAETTLSAILGYMPTLPHWGYNGNARRYWDFLYGGKLSRIERQFHHYGSGLNAIPVLKEYRAHPDDFYLLRVGYGGVMGPLSNINQDGFASAAFHSFPSTLKWDAYSGDYGPNFLGHALNTATYLVNHPDFGWQAFGGNVSTHGDWITVEPRDSFRSRVYIAPAGLWLTLDAGAFEQVEYNVKTRTVRVGLAASTADTPLALLRIEQPVLAAATGRYAPPAGLKSDRGGFIAPLSDAVTWVELGPGK